MWGGRSLGPRLGIAGRELRCAKPHRAEQLCLGASDEVQDADVDGCCDRPESSQVGPPCVRCLHSNTPQPFIRLHLRKRRERADVPPRPCVELRDRSSDRHHPLDGGRRGDDEDALEIIASVSPLQDCAAPQLVADVQRRDEPQRLVFERGELHAHVAAQLLDDLGRELSCPEALKEALRHASTRRGGTSRRWSSEVSAGVSLRAWRPSSAGWSSSSKRPVQLVFPTTHLGLKQLDDLPHLLPPWLVFLWFSAAALRGGELPGFEPC